MTPRVVEIVDEAFAIGLQQIREEILELATYLAARPLRHVLEIGAAAGGSFYIWCRLADPRGKKVSVDLPGGIYGGEPQANRMTRYRRDRMMRGWAPGVHLVAGISASDEVRSQVAAVLGADRLDLLFIDGDHTYEAVKADFELYSRFVSPSGAIAFHDINDTAFHRAQNVGVARLWSALEGDKREFNARREWGGIGVLTGVRAGEAAADRVVR
ncbi:MAG: class I SAM-dependent methyltransferase [Vicinamibacterales bacterium]